MFHKTINLIKNNYNLKNTFVKTKNLNKNDFKIIKIFIQFNIIKIVKQNKKIFYIYFNYPKNSVVFNSIKNLFRPSKPNFLNLEQIKKINKKSNNIFILSTNKGLLTNFEAEKIKVGGTLVLMLHI